MCMGNGPMNHEAKENFSLNKKNMFKIKYRRVTTCQVFMMFMFLLGELFFLQLLLGELLK